MSTANHPEMSLEETREAYALLAFQALAPLADHWGFRIMREVFAGVHRYGELQRKLGIARNILAERLATLVEAELLERVRYRTEPDWYEYRLTKRAADFYPTIITFYEWVDAHFGDPEHSIFQEPHKCGRPSRPVVVCSACGEPIGIERGETVPAP